MDKTQIGGIAGKVEAELTSIFPSQFQEIKAIEYYSALNNRTSAILDSIITNADNSSTIAKEESLLQKIIGTARFFGKDSAEIKHIKSYDQASLIIAKEFNTDVRNMTTRQYFTAVDRLREMSEQLKKQAKNGR